jgi:outer membrane lipoprotein carrier protein
LWLKKPRKMRWEYRSPKEKLFLSDGRSAWFWVVGERQVQRTQLKQLEDLRSPIALLLGKTRLEKELQALSFAPDIVPLEPGDVVLRGVPKAMADRVAQIVLEITPERWIHRILIEEVDASTTEYRFTDQKENLALPDQKFQFQLPPGAEVIDGEIGP